MTDDQQSVSTRYFDEHCPDYSPERLDVAVRWIRREVPLDASLVDIGCGTGAVLAYLRERSRLTDLTGIDPSTESLAVLRRRLDCPTQVGSILDPELPVQLDRRFDVVVLAAVLHHLVGSTRSESRRLAREGVRNALRLTAPGGTLIIVEPVFYPRATMGLVFHLKRLVTRFTDRRVELLDMWNNIGAPVVSYLTDEELERFAQEAGGRIADKDVEVRDLHPLMRLGGIRRRQETTLFVRNPVAVDR